MEKKATSPFNAFHEPYVGLTGFETTYKSIKIVDTVKKTGEGDDDFVVVKKVIVEEIPIQEVIDADKDSVGVENIIKMVLRTGDTSLLPVDRGDCNVDLTNAPENLMELKQMGINAEKAFKSLPEELTQGLDMISFVNSMSQEKFDQFIQAVADRKKVSAGKDDKVNE